MTSLTATASMLTEAGRSALAGACFTAMLFVTSVAFWFGLCSLESPPQFTSCGHIRNLYELTLTDAQCVDLPAAGALIEYNGLPQRLSSVETANGPRLYFIDSPTLAGVMLEPRHPGKYWEPIQLIRAFTPILGIAGVLASVGGGLLIAGKTRHSTMKRHQMPGM